MKLAAAIMTEKVVAATSDTMPPVSPLHELSA
jgi:hypothetical protein